jgi:hypothetical protein
MLNDFGDLDKPPGMNSAIKSVARPWLHPVARPTVKILSVHGSGHLLPVALAQHPTGDVGEDRRAGVLTD